MTERSHRSALTVSELSVARPPQPRGQGAWLDVYDEGGRLGRFEETTSEELAGAAIVRLISDDGSCPLAITHPSRRARVDGPEGVIGFVSRVGRVRINWELHGSEGGARRPMGEPLTVLRPLTGAGTGWQGSGATLRAWAMGTPTASDYGEARYSLSLPPDVTDALRSLLLALVPVVDRSLVQAIDAPT